MNIGVLTSSRADYGIYKPLLNALSKDPFFDLSIIAFGTHLSPFHDRSLNLICQDGFQVDYKINSLLLTDDENSLSTGIGLTTIKFADFWQENKGKFDVVFCLGDRYEMFAAVIAGVPFGITFAHIHGGETTLGAIDNVFRHTISLSSKIHYVATEVFADKVKSLVDNNTSEIVVTGALSLDNLADTPLLTKEEFYDKWKVDLSIPSILVTIHPETVKVDEIASHLFQIKETLTELQQNYQLIITMPNADSYGSRYRHLFQELANRYPAIKLIENFGTQSYFSCMKYVQFLLGNTSSGIIEAASFGKYVINIGDRQKGRLSGKNVIHVPTDKIAILNAVDELTALSTEPIDNIYYRGGAVNRIISHLKSMSIIT